MQERLFLTNVGQEVQISDLNAMGQAASAADDQALAELLRLPWGSGSGANKFILPFAVHNIPGAIAWDQTPTVVPYGASGSVAIYPFRAVVGSRTAPGTSLSLAWADIRTAFFAGSAPGIPSVTVSLAANSSGSTRWDLVYAAVSVDGPTRRRPGPC